MRTSFLMNVAGTVLASLCGAVGSAAESAPASASKISIGVWNNQLLVTAPASDERRLPGGEQRMTVDWRDVTLGEAVAALRGMTNLNIICLPGVEETRLTLTVKNMPLTNVVTWMATLTSLHTSYQREALVFSPTAIEGESVTRLYDVSDLTTPMRNFPGPELSIPVAGGTGALLIMPAEPSTAATDPEELAEFLRRQVHAE